MNRTIACLLSLSVALPLAACRPMDEADPYRDAIPSAQTVAVEVPTKSGQAVAVEGQPQALQGQTSEFYRLTRTVSRTVNGGVLAVLGLVRAVVRHPPTSVAENTAVWGPFSEALSPNAWRVTVTKMSDQEYRYVFEGKDKTQPDTAFVKVLQGTHRPTLDGGGDPVEGLGTGDFLLDFDAARTLPEHDDNLGSATVAYARPALGQTATIAAQFRAVKDDEQPGRRVDVDYAYEREPGDGGRLSFSFAPLAQGDETPALFSVNSRWLPTGAGRSDVVASGGDIPAGTQATANECWNESFASVYMQKSWDAAGSYGDLAQCAFQDTTYRALQP